MKDINFINNQYQSIASVLSILEKINDLLSKGEKVDVAYSGILVEHLISRLRLSAYFLNSKN